MSERCAHTGLIFAIVAVDFNREKVAKIVPERGEA
jgi:hypothetical protein